jgi:hypothetical protein
VRILDNDPKGTNGGTLYEFENKIQARLVDMINGNYDKSIEKQVSMILSNVLTQNQAEHKYWQSRKK